MSQELRKFYAARYVGQEAIVSAIEDAFDKVRGGLNDTSRPYNVALLLGPTGTGKTLAVELFTKFLFDDVNAAPELINCTEYQQEHEVAKLIGAPPGYLGHGETQAFLTPKRFEGKQTRFGFKATVLLLDEFEKAAPSLERLMLNIWDKAQAKNGRNESIDFSTTFIFATSNLGANSVLAKAAPGFANNVIACTNVDAAAKEAARKHFAPEAYNRIDDVVVAKPQTHKQIQQVLDIELGKLNTRMRSKCIAIECTQTMKDTLLATGYDIRYGSRELKRAIERNVTRPLARYIADNGTVTGTLIADIVDNATQFTYKSVVLAPAPVVPTWVSPAPTVAAQGQATAVRTQQPNTPKSTTPRTDEAPRVYYCTKCDREHRRTLHPMEGGGNWNRYWLHLRKHKLSN